MFLRIKGLKSWIIFLSVLVFILLLLILVFNLLLLLLPIILTVILLSYFFRMLNKLKKREQPKKGRKDTKGYLDVQFKVK